MASNTYWDSVVDRLREIERDWTHEPPRSGVITTDHRGMPGLSSGIMSTTTAAANYVGGILYAMPGASAYRNTVRRVHNVTNAINGSFPAAFGEMERRLGGISVSTIADVLTKMLRDVAITLGGSTALGAGIGGVAGAFAFGIGAAPGAGIGATAGFEMGNLILTFTGLKSVVTFMKDAVPAAMHCYGTGFRNAWGKKDDAAPFAHWAYKDFAMGHVLFFMAILMGIVGYLLRKGDFPMLMAEIRASPRLGPKFADWVTANKDALLKNPALMQGMRASAGAGSAESEAPTITGPLRGQTPPNLIDPNAPIQGQALAPSQLAPVQSVWSMRPTARGRAIEDQLAETDYADWYRVGAERNGYFPLVDFQNGNDLVSVKSADTTGSSWMSDLKDHIDDLDNYRGAVGGNPANMFLDLRVQPGGFEAAQPLVDYGVLKNVTVLVQEFP